MTTPDDITTAVLDADAADPDPIRQFESWYREAHATPMREPTAMTLATASPDGRPSARIVLLKAADERGFAFFTNYQSRKGGELEHNPWAALVFHWPDLVRQVRVEGRVAKVSDEESDAYFKTRPRGSQLGAWASEQSRAIKSRADLERRVQAVEATYEDREIPRPPHWGGLRLVPVAIEFWQGRLDRLHDRVLYSRADDGGWTRERLSP
ncbi:MAG TPA: pyridoxamine 5'-phosphate oxidase [Polyangiaceae bacterium]|jgi:pyridoxamine 5'-phosphate oxidase|nr:pyridoxamine 5'-phosphate oxidase [Polyangiaceae bacterium]